MLLEKISLSRKSASWNTPCFCVLSVTIAKCFKITDFLFFFFVSASQRAHVLEISVKYVCAHCGLPALQKGLKESVKSMMNLVAYIAPLRHTNRYACWVQDSKAGSSALVCATIALSNRTRELSRANISCCGNSATCIQ